MLNYKQIWHRIKPTYSWINSILHGCYYHILFYWVLIIPRKSHADNILYIEYWGLIYSIGYSLIIPTIIYIFLFTISRKSHGLKIQAIGQVRVGFLCAQTRPTGLTLKPKPTPFIKWVFSPNPNPPSQAPRAPPPQVQSMA